METASTVTSPEPSQSENPVQDQDSPMSEDNNPDVLGILEVVHVETTTEAENTDQAPAQATNINTELVLEMARAVSQAVIDFMQRSAN